MICVLVILAALLKYRPKEGIIGPGVTHIITNKPFVTLVRLQTALLTLTVTLGVNLEEILELLEIH